MLRTEADALEEQLKSSVEKLAILRHELFDTPATTFPENSRPVPFDELLQYASNISKHTVPPTYRERVPEAAAVGDKAKEDAGSSGAPTNGLNTPANISDAAEPQKDPVIDHKEDENTNGAAPEVTAEEEEWLKKLKENQFTWYPWPSTDKIRQGNLYRLQYWREKHVDLDKFNIPAYEEEQRLKNLPVTELPQQEPQQEGAPSDAGPPQAAAPAPAPAPRRPRPNQEAFDLFDDMDED